MSSGNKSVLIAVDERAEPSDITLLQRLEAQRSGEIARWLVAGKLAGGFFSNPGMHSAYEVGADAAVPTDEVAHQCLSGLMVRPGTTFCAVDPGGAAFYQPLRTGLSADDTPWIFGFSPGLNDAAQLTFLANGGPGIRWDIIECQAAGDTTEPQQLRQVFDEVARVFNPLLVDKRQSSVFTFRIRRGVQGAGIPAIDANWMPLAAVHVRTDSTSFADTDLYDIRPLTTDRCEWSARAPFAAPSAGGTTRSVLYEAEFSPQVQAGVNGLLLQGYFRSQFGGYWSGGVVRRNDAATNAGDFNNQGVNGGDLDGFNFENPEVRSGAFALVAETVITLGAFFPRGYPRWVRYSQPALASNATTRLRVAGRYPQGCRGILMVLNGPDGGGLVRKNGIIQPATLPTTMGETTGAWGQVVCYAVVGTAGTDVYPPSGSSVDQKYYWPLHSVTYAGANAPGPNFTTLATLAGGAFTTDALANPSGTHSAVATITNGTAGVPQSAAAMLTDIQAVISLLTAKDLQQTIARVDIGGTVIDVSGSWENSRNDSGGTVNMFQQGKLWVPLRANIAYDAASAPGATKLALAWTAGPGAAMNATPLAALNFLGYQL